MIEESMKYPPLIPILVIMFILSQVRNSTFYNFYFQHLPIARALIIKFILRNKNAYCSPSLPSFSPSLLSPFPSLILYPLTLFHLSYPPTHIWYCIPTYHLSLFTHYTQLTYFIFFFFLFFSFFYFFFFFFFFFFLSSSLVLSRPSPLSLVHSLARPTLLPSPSLLSSLMHLPTH